MKMIVAFMIWSSLLPLSDSLESIRTNYQKAVNDKELCREMMQKLNRDNLKGIETAYLGAFQALWAKHAINPFSKLSHFNNGKANIEKAILLEPNNAEIRLIRLSVQKNAPGFLGYNSNIDEDTEYVRANARAIESPVLLEMMDNLLNKE